MAISSDLLLLQEAVDAGLLDPDDSETAVAMYRYVEPRDRLLRFKLEVAAIKLAGFPIGENKRSTTGDSISQTGVERP